MTGKTHQVIGVTAGLATYLFSTHPVYGPATLGASLVVAHIGALLPDIDQPASVLWHALPFGHMAGELINPFLQHRNITHSIVGVALVGWGLFSLLQHMPDYWGISGSAVWIAGMTAYGSHLLADMVTVEGIPLLWPYQRMFGIPPRPFQGARIQTGKWFENLVIFPTVNIVLIALLYTQWPVIKAILFH